MTDQTSVIYTGIHNSFLFAAFHDICHVPRPIIDVLLQSSPRVPFLGCHSSDRIRDQSP